MGKHIQGKDGKFAGSIGDGKTDLPTPDDRPRSTTPAPGTEDVNPDYQALHESMQSLMDSPAGKWSIAEATPTNPLQDECRSVRLGGQLCARHAAAAVHQAEQRLSAYLDEEPYPDSRRSRQYQQEVDDARIDYASTREGQEAFTRLRDQALYEGDHADNAPLIKAAYRRAEEFEALLAAGRTRAATNNATAARVTALARNMHLNNQVSYEFLQEHGFLDNETHYGHVTPENAGQTLGELLTLLPGNDRYAVINRYGLQTGVPDPTDRHGENNAVPLYYARNTDSEHSRAPEPPDQNARYQAFTPEANAYLAEETQRTINSTIDQLRLFGGSVTANDIASLTDNITSAAHRAHPNDGCTDTEPRTQVHLTIERALRNAGYYTDY